MVIKQRIACQKEKSTGAGNGVPASAVKAPRAPQKRGTVFVQPVEIGSFMNQEPPAGKPPAPGAGLPCSGSKAIFSMASYQWPGTKRRCFPGLCMTIAASGRALPSSRPQAPAWGRTWTPGSVWPKQLNPRSSPLGCKAELCIPERFPSWSLGTRMAKVARAGLRARHLGGRCPP